jgi:hypothetical protein
MWQCILCRFDVVYDDVVVGNMKRGRCICLVCYMRDVGGTKVMNKDYRRDIQAVLAGCNT